MEICLYPFSQEIEMEKHFEVDVDYTTEVRRLLLSA